MRIGGLINVDDTVLQVTVGVSERPGQLTDIARLVHGVGANVDQGDGRTKGSLGCGLRGMGVIPPGGGCRTVNPLLYAWRLGRIYPSSASHVHHLF